MRSKIKDINTRLQEIVTQKNDLQLRDWVGGRTPPSRPKLPTTSLVEGLVYGRKEDQKAIPVFELFRNAGILPCLKGWLSMPLKFLTTASMGFHNGPMKEDPKGKEHCGIIPRELKDQAKQALQSKRDNLFRIPKISIFRILKDFILPYYCVSMAQNVKINFNNIEANAAMTTQCHVQDSFSYELFIYSKVTIKEGEAFEFLLGSLGSARHIIEYHILMRDMYKRLFVSWFRPFNYFNGLAWLFLSVPKGGSLLYKEEFEKMNKKHQITSECMPGHVWLEEEAEEAVAGR
ncbi:hypothetical protein CFP56_001396 [Quercus suber]|uniref:Uncharacterized protein n=1 Tax=Quercus suber TaxID=58331 RepID=A0AAW0IM60_QUESU